VRRAYVDTSCLIAIAFEEKNAAALARRLASFDTLVSSNLLEAEFLAPSARHRRDLDWTNLVRIRWLYPDRSLRPEITRVLAEGYVRGADCWHLATALYAAVPEPSSISFLTLDRRQQRIARALGFGE
jgi:predicted nucleic acid-binding protein